MKPVLLFFIGLTVSSAAIAARLDDLFLQADRGTFFVEAHAAAALGDADALFLLGKAYHLGKGVAADEDQARDYYEQARTKGSARASHNLGLIELDHGNREAAIVLLNEALERGLTMPTLYNLGRAHSPPDQAYALHLREPIDSAVRSGDYFTRAHAAQPNMDYIFQASREYLRAYQFAQHASSADMDGLDLSSMRARAAEWLQKGIEQDHGPSWTNYGALLLMDGDDAGAYAAFEKGAAHQIAVAHHHLAKMVERGQGPALQEGVNAREKALFHHEQAVLLGVEASRSSVRTLLVEQLMSETDLKALERGIERLDALRGEEADFAESVTSPRARLAWGRFLERNRQQAQRLPKRTAVVRTCGFGWNEPHGSAYNVHYNTSWRLVAYSSLDDSEPMGIEGRVSKSGCIATRALPARVLKLLDEGAVLALRFPNYTLPLRWFDTSKGIELRVSPVETPIPSF